MQRALPPWSNRCVECNESMDGFAVEDMPIGQRHWRCPRSRMTERDYAYDATALAQDYPGWEP